MASVFPGEERACFLPEAAPLDYDEVTGNYSFPEPLRCQGVIDQACHGFCIGPLECTRSDIFWENEFALTIFDWQNVVYLALILGVMAVGKYIFRRVYQLHLEEAGVATQIETWWAHATDEPAVLMCLAAYIYSVSNIVHASITEFESVDNIFYHVGYSTQMTGDGITARVWNIAAALGWTTVALIMMQISQLVVRMVMFNNMEGQTIQQLVASGIVGPDAKSKGSNIAAGICEAGCVVASGIVAAASISGAPSRDKWADLGVAILYFALSQVSLVVYMKVFDHFYLDGTIEDALVQRLPQDHHLNLPRNQKCDQGNVAAAISFVAMAISFSIHISQAVYTSFELLNFVIVVVFGGGLQLLMRPVLRRLVIFGGKTTDEHTNDFNWGFSLVVGSLQVYFARVLASLVVETCVDLVYSPDYHCTTGGWDCGDGFVKVSNQTHPEIFRHTSCWSDEDVCISLGVQLLYGIEGWAAVESRTSKCMAADAMGLWDRLVETEYALAFFSWSRLWKVLTTLIFLFLGRLCYSLPYTVHSSVTNAANLNLKEALEDQRKHAICLSFAGYIFGYATVVESQFHTLNLSDLSKVFEDGADTHRIDQFLSDVGWVLVGMIMMFLSELLTHNFVLRAHSNSQELMVEDNRALGCIEAGSYVASGFIISACITLDDGWLAIFFYLAGEAALMAFSFIYQMTTSYDDERSIHSKNVASGLHWGLSLAALGLHLSRALRLSQSIVVFFVWFGLGAPILLAVSKIVNLVIFPKLNIDDELYTAPTPDVTAQNPLEGGPLEEGGALAHRMRGGNTFEIEGGMSPAQPRIVSQGSVRSMSSVPPPSVRLPPASPAAVDVDTIDKAFRTYDIDNSGSLTKDECVDLINALGLNVSRQYLEGVWSVYDTNGDGTLDMEEFRIFYVVLQKRSEAMNAQQGQSSSPSVRSRVTSFEQEQRMSASYSNNRYAPSVDTRDSQSQAASDNAYDARSQHLPPSDDAALSRTSTRQSGGAKRVHNWGVALVLGTLIISTAQLLNTFLRDCSFEFGLH